MCVKMHVRLLTRLGAECSAAYDGLQAVQAVEAALQLDAAAQFDPGGIRGVETVLARV